MALSITLERFAYRWKSREILDFVTELGMYHPDGECEQNIVRFYQKTSNRINTLFVFFTSVLSTAVAANYFSNVRLAVFSRNEIICGRFFVDIWVPQVLCRSPWYEIMFLYNVFISLSSFVMAYISLVAVPLLAIQIASKFEIVAQKFQCSLSTLADRTVVGDHLINKNIKTTIQLHQSILEAANLMNSSFHIIVLIKMVFMSLPMIVVSLVMSQTEFGSFQFLRHALYFTLLLFQLFFFCFFGEQITENSLKVHGAVYNNQWYTLSLANQKLLLTVATRAGKPAQLEVWPNFVPVSLENFLNICRFTYSVYSVLVVTTSK